MCYDIWATFKGSTLRERGCTAELKRFGLYCTYAFGIPIIFTSTLIAMDFIEDVPIFLKPGIGLQSCFMEKRIQFVLMYLPISLILFVSCDYV
jgi:hypothetical protein